MEQRKVDIAIFVSFTVPKACLNLPPLLKKKSRRWKKRRKKNVLAGTFNILLKEKWGEGSQCEKHCNLGKVSAYCEILYPTNNVGSSKIPSVRHIAIFLMDVAWIFEVNKLSRSVFFLEQVLWSVLEQESSYEMQGCSHVALL